MKLSEAILIGAAIRPQAFGDYVKDGRTCALGAAYEALFDRLPPAAQSEHCRVLSEIAPYGGYNDSANPVSGKAGPICDICVELNDDQLWTREEIATWLAEQGL